MEINQKIEAAAKAMAKSEGLDWGKMQDDSTGLDLVRSRAQYRLLAIVAFASAPPATANAAYITPDLMIYRSKLPGHHD